LWPTEKEIWRFRYQWLRLPRSSPLLRMVRASLTRGQCGMRKVLVAIVVLIVVVWLIPYDPLPDGEKDAPRPVAPVAATPESDSIPATDSAPAISAEPAANDSVEAPVLLPDQVALSPMAQKALSAQSLREPGLTAIEQAFAAERVDPLWATEMEGNILGQLAQANLQLVTMQVECRTSMCRVQLMESPSKNPDMNAFRDLVRGFGLDVWRMNNLGNQSGALTTVAYLARREPMSPAQQQALLRELQRTLPPAQREAAITVLRGDLEANIDREPQAATPPASTPPGP
jgi:hypothetical protein